jgi:hypothetical protein
VHVVRPGVSTSGTLDAAGKPVAYEGKPVTIKL